MYQRRNVTVCFSSGAGCTSEVYELTKAEYDTLTPPAQLPPALERDRAVLRCRDGVYWIIAQQGMGYGYYALVGKTAVSCQVVNTSLPETAYNPVNFVPKTTQLGACGACPLPSADRVASNNVVGAFPGVPGKLPFSDVPKPPPQPPLIVEQRKGFPWWVLLVALGMGWATWEYGR